MTSPLQLIPYNRTRSTDKLPRDIIEHLRGLLVASRDAHAARLAELAAAHDHRVFDAHAAISLTLANDALDDIEHALSRIDASTYGSCESCGAPIPFERLEAIPYARTCVACAVLSS
jgi:RNA polymerase-binding transcription factor DksA